jgi:hypothetical protein
MCSDRTAMRLLFHFFGSVGISLLCNLPGPWPILVRSVVLVQGLVFRPGVGVVPGSKDSLFLWVMGGMDGRSCHRVVLMVFGMAALVRAGRAAFMGGYRLACW